MSSFFEYIKGFFGDNVKKSHNDKENEEIPEKMLTDEVIYNRLIRNEGISFKPYKCPAGYLTIGVGRNLELNPLTKEEKEVIGDVMSGITKDQAFMLLRHDVDGVRRDLDQHFPFWKELNDDRQFVMIDLCFNMGINKLLDFKNTMRFLAQGNYERAADNLLLSKYAKQVKSRAERNANCIRTGKYEY